jgi:hypothetical protein
MYLTFSCLKIPAKRVLFYPKDALGRRGIPSAKYKICNPETGKWVLWNQPVGSKVIQRLARAAGFEAKVRVTLEIVNEEDKYYVLVKYE